MTTNFTKDRQVLDCGCSLMDGRCDKHAGMMRQVHYSYYHVGGEMADRIYDLSDGYGEPGYVPEQGRDWSGVRDSSIEAIEAMYAAVTAVPE